MVQQNQSGSVVDVVVAEESVVVTVSESEAAAVVEISGEGERVRREEEDERNLKTEDEGEGEGEGDGDVAIDKLKGNVCEREKEECVIDVKCNSGEGWSKESMDDCEKLCRICYLSANKGASAEVVMELIVLGCSCKDELGTVHRHCAETWFKLKGNRSCEICGDSAKNITGVGDNSFTEDWDERMDDSNSVNTSERRGFCRGQPFCNFLMACLVIAFILPWFFHVNVF